MIDWKERSKVIWSLFSICGDNVQILADALRDAHERGCMSENDACAKLADEYNRDLKSGSGAARTIALRIRLRNKRRAKHAEKDPKV